MRSKKTKWLTLAIAPCFVILQALLPFIHGHLDLDHSIHKIGFHLIENHEELNHSSDHPSDHALSDVHVSHIVVVASGIKQDADPALFADFFSFASLWVCFAIVLLSVQRHFPQLYLIPNKFLKRRLPAPRAPPLF
jgi:hypothetical protein